MDRRDWTASAIGTLALVCALLLVAGIAMAQPMKLSEDLALEVHAIDDVRLRGSASALIRPTDPQLLMVQLASDNARIQPAVGVRWWLAQRRASFDLMARRSLDGQRVEPQIGLPFAFGD
jgi:hypothetical protein